MTDDNLNASCESASEPQTPVNPKPFKATGLTLSISLIALAASAWACWQSLQNSHDHVTQRELIDQTNGIARINSEALSQLQEQNRQLQTQVQTLIQQNTPNRLALNEARDWLRAAQTSQLMNNNSNAIQYLEQAAQRIGTLNNPEFQAIRTAINQDLNNLKNSVSTDPESLIIKLDSISQNIAKLPTVLNPNSSAKAKPNNTQNPYEPTNWKERLATSLAYLKDFIVIKHNSDLPMLTAEQQASVKMNIQLKITETEWAVIQLQDSLYQHNLKIIAELLQIYFVHSADSTAILNQLTELQQQHLKAVSTKSIQSLEVVNAKLNRLASFNSTPTNQSVTNRSNKANGEVETKIPHRPIPTKSSAPQSVEA